MLLYYCSKACLWILYREISVLQTDRKGRTKRVRLARFKNKRPALIFANHPNGLIDGFIVGAFTRNQLRAVVKSTLYNSPLIRPFLKASGSVPVFRSIDKEINTNSLHKGAKKLSDNLGAISAVSTALLKSKVIIYPEGISHDLTKLLPIKPGGALMAQGTSHLFQSGLYKNSSMGHASDIELIPLGIQFENCHKFRSRTVLHYGKPLMLDQILSQEEIYALKENTQTESGTEKIRNRMKEELNSILITTDNRNDQDLLKLASGIICSHRARYSALYETSLLIRDSLNEIKSTGLKEKLDKLSQQLQQRKLDISDINFLRLKNSSQEAILRKRKLQLLVKLPLAIVSSPILFPLAKVFDRLAIQASQDRVEIATYKFFYTLVFGFLAILTTSLLSIQFFRWVGLPWGVTITTALVFPLISLIVYLKSYDDLQQLSRVFFYKKSHYYSTEDLNSLLEQRTEIKDQLNKLMPVLKDRQL